MKWIFIIALTVALSLTGAVVTPTSANGDTIWIAIILTWNPTNRTIDKEFTSEINCWNYYENGVGESKFGTQVLDHQGNKPGKEYHKKHRPPHREYPTRLYHGKDGDCKNLCLIWLTCDIKGRYVGL